MPFPTRIIPHRTDIDDVFSNPTHSTHDNILQKTNVSNLVGLMTQFNNLSLHAHAIFSDIVTTTQSSNDRIQSIKKRVSDLENALPKYESMFHTNAPSYFYDNPYSGKEYLRKDPLHGLLFTRTDATQTVNKRRAIATPPADLSPLDHLSKHGACIKQLTDSDLFINEWLQNERRKRTEKKEKRKILKHNRKQGKVRRKHNKTIQKLHRKRYDDEGNEIKTENEPTEITVTQYELTDTRHEHVLSKLSQLSAEIPMDDIWCDIPEDALSPSEIYAKTYQKRDLDNEVLDLAKASEIIASSPPQIPPVPPKLMKNDEKTPETLNVKPLTDVNVNRHKPDDKRTNLLLSIKENKVRLNPIVSRPIAAKTEGKRNLIFEEMNKRRNYMVDSSDSGASDWGSDSY